MTIRLAIDADMTSWDRYVDSHPEGLAYHYYGWRQSVEKAYPHRGHYLLAESPGGISGVLPLIEFRVPLKGSTLVSLPFCDAGGILADDPESRRGLFDAAVSLAGSIGARLLEMRCGALSEGFLSCRGRTDKVRMVLELAESGDALLAGFKAKLRSQVKKPLRDGLTARTGGSELVDEFYRIFSENMRDLGSPVHSKIWIRKIVSHYGDRVRVGLVYAPDGSPAAGGIILLHPRTVSIPWASSLRRFNRYNPNMLLYWTFLSFAADHGFARFDFGRSTPDEGTYRFKEQWGAQPQGLVWQHYDPSGQMLPDVAPGPMTGRRQQLESLWKRLPRAVADTLGPRVRQFVSL